MSPADPPSPAHCPICGSALDPSLAAGGCPACLWGNLIAEEKKDRIPLADAPEIEGYRVLEEVGRGGMGVVYRAQQESPARVVALKIVAPYSLRATQERLRFMVEIGAMAAVTHPALLPLYETGEDDHGRPWFTMQLAAGGTLGQRIGSYAGDWRATAQLLVTLCGAVQYAHERGILHRDLKPANVLFDDRGGAYVADFGLAKWADRGADFTQSTDLLGSPVYLAPEAAAGGAKATTTASDVYGLGTILYELLTGKKPYEAASAAQVLTQILAQSPPAPRQHKRDIPRDLEVITQKAIARDPARRYASAAALAQDLQRWLDGRPIEARPVGRLERAWIWARRNPALAGLSFLLLASLTTGGILLWRANQRLNASLNDARARVEFMTRELPQSLAPLGRLDLLDSVFQNVSEHYALGSGDSPDSLAREADFLAQWAQILRPRGLNLEAVSRLRQAMEKARAATSGSSPSLAAVRSRVATGWRLAEALIEGKQHDEAEALLNEAAAYAAATGPKDDERLRILDTLITLEHAYLAQSRWQWPEVTRHATAAMVKWQELLPVLELPPISASHQGTLMEVMKCHQLLAISAGQQKETDPARTHWTNLKTMAERLITAAPDNAQFRTMLIRAHWGLAGMEGQPPEESIRLLLSAEELAAALIVRDPTNMQWLTDAVACARELATLYRKTVDAPGHLRWRATLSQRLERLYQASSTDLRFLLQRWTLAGDCARLHLPDDWPTARRHYLAQLEARRLATNLPASGSTLEEQIAQFAKLIEKHEGQPAAAKWQEEYRKSLPR